MLLGLATHYMSFDFTYKHMCTLLYQYASVCIHFTNGTITVEKFAQESVCVLHTAE